MFDFENLKVYKTSRDYLIEINRFVKKKNIDRITQDQLKRASLSIVLNIAEGSGRRTYADKRRFLYMSRGSVYECVAIFDYLKTTQTITTNDFQRFYNLLDEISRMLYAFIKYYGKEKE